MNISTKLLKAAAGQGGGAGLDVDEVFSTNLWEGNGTARSITNGIDLSSEGGLVWFKMREAGFAHRLVDTERGVTKKLESQADAAEGTEAQGLTAFNSDGFTIGTADNYNLNTYDMVSWTFRKAPKFFDVVTWTSNGSGSQRVNHNLGAVPGHIVMKRTDADGPWLMSPLYSDGDRGYRQSSSTFGFDSTGYIGTKTSGLSSGFTATDFRPEYIDGYGTYTNINGATFVAYLFAHNNNDGEFGPDGDADIIKCGSYSGNGSASGPSINLGFEPQFLMIKRSSGTNGWNVFDTMRGWTNNAGYVDNTIAWNSTDAEGTGFYWHNPTSTGFDIAASNDNVNANGDTYIYMAIRKGPLFVPEDATKVFNVNTYSNNSNSNIYNTGFDVDMSLSTNRDGNNNFIKARMTGTKYLQTNATAAEGATTTAKWFNSKSNSLDLATNWWGSNNAVSWAWRRAPSYFDVVCYTGNSTSNTEIKHNLGAVPEMVWTKRRSGTRNWVVYHTALGINNTMWLNEDSQADDESAGMHATPTATSLFLKGNNYTNLSGATHIAYLFATVAGVSKVGSYTGNGSSQNIDCGFSSGARFVLIKRTDVSEGWKVHDSVRGIVAGNDPFIELNNNNAENSSFDLLDPYSGGFAVNNFYGWNGSGGSYIFYAIA